MRDRRPHICFVAPNAFPLLINHPDLQVVGGAELQQVIIARGLVQRGYPVSMICLDYGQEDKLEVDGIAVHRAYRPTEGLPVLRFIWPRMTEIWRCLARANADIYYHRAASVLTGVMAAYCRRHDKKSIFAVAGVPVIRFARDRLIYRYGIRNVDRVVVQNEMQKRFVQEKFGREGILIPNCYHPAAPLSAAAEGHVLWVSTIRQIKRPDLFLDLAEALPGYRFTMVGGPGDGESALFESIRERAAGLDNVDFAGFRPYSETERYFDNALLFINTSESEGFPNTFLQAWAREVPTVSFVDCGARACGTAVGCLVETMDEMVESVAALVKDAAKRTELGKSSRRYVEENHSTDRILDRYEELLQDLHDCPLASATNPEVGT